MNTTLNRFRKETVKVSVLMAELKNSPENSLDNDKSRAIDATESDKSYDKADQADHTPLGMAPEASAFMTEVEKAKFDKTQDEAKTEQPDHAKGTPEP